MRIALLSNVLGFFCCLFATAPVLAEAPLDQGYIPKQQGEEGSELTNLPVETDPYRYRPATLLKQPRQELQPKSTLTLPAFSTEDIKAHIASLQWVPNFLSDRQVQLSFPSTTASEIKVDENLVFADKNGWRRDTNYRWEGAGGLSVGLGVVDNSSSLTSETLSWSEMPPTTRTHDNSDWKYNLKFQPWSQFGINFNGNYNSSQIALNLQPISGLTFTGSRNNQNETLAGGVQLSQKFGEEVSFSARANIDSEDRWRWGVNSNLGGLQLNYQTNGDPNSLGMNSQVGFNFAGNNPSGAANILKVGYETRDTQNQDNRLTTFGWQFRTGKGEPDDPSQWEFDVSYGIGTEGNGLITSVSTKLRSGLTLRARYQQVSLTSDSDTFKLELMPFSD
ncbi:hypothetical protein HC931_14135 [Candidatus Gracilibacteria bacterium]|nr:hypothetical protein [Candidatus Gracilibacteria bacterium]NJM86540.1 hypothetical protein [Hydrococcus sp. RU_2_2]NJP19528.1 hypothetical protein [Hydrococcus sp. CRU_1_1]